MIKKEALELLKSSNLMEPEDNNGDPVLRIIGEHSETETTFNWVVYWCRPEKVNDRTYGFMYFVNKTTREVSHASAPLSKRELEYIQH